MEKPPEGLEIVVLTPDTIPAYAERTGESEEELLQKFEEAEAKNQALFGCIMGWPYFLNEVEMTDGG